MNAAIGLGLQELPTAPDWAQVPLQALIAGFTAGFCEEWARWFILRASLKRRPSWAHLRGALAHGIGHGGIESAILGGLVIMTLLNMIFLRDFQGELPGVTPDQMEAVRRQVVGFWATPPAMTLVGAGERMMTMVLHVAFSLLVFRGVVLGKRSLVWLAIAWHWLLDTSVVLAVGWLGAAGAGIWVAEAIVLVHAIGAVVVIRRFLRRDSALLG